MVDRYLDLLKQGFMKPRSAPRGKKPEPKIITCDACQDWHREGKHTAPAAVRQANRAAARAGRYVAKEGKNV